MTEIKIGDPVFHRDEAHPMRLGRVIGFGPIDRWLRIKRVDGKKAIWARENVSVLDADFAEELEDKWR